MFNNHLGGHTNINHIETNAILYLKKKFNIKSILDIGCSNGNNIKNLISHKFDIFGIEGDREIVEKSSIRDKIIIHDFTEGKYNFDREFDLSYTTEFMEHVEEKYIDNYFCLFENSKYIFYTAAPKYWTGCHHVNCQDHEYWLKKFNERGFIFDPITTYKCREISDMNNHRKNNKKFIKHRGMFFINTKYLNEINFKEGITNLNGKEDTFNYNIKFQAFENENMRIILRQVPKYMFKSTIPLISFCGTKEDLEKNIKCKINIIK